MTTKTSLYSLDTNKKVGTLGYNFDGNVDFNAMVFNFSSKNDLLAEIFIGKIREFLEENKLIMVSQSFGNSFHGRKSTGKNQSKLDIYMKRGSPLKPYFEKIELNDKPRKSGD